MQFNNKKSIFIIFILIFLVIILTFYYKFNGYEIDEVKYEYNVTSIIEEEQNALGTYTLTRKLNDSNQIEIDEIELFNVHIYSEDKLDEVKNHKTYLFDKNFKLISLTENEYLNGELNLNRFFELKNLKNVIEINTYENNNKQETIYLPNDKTNVSLATSGIFDLLNLSSKRVSYENMYFTKNIDKSIEQYYLLERTSILNPFFGNLNCDIVKYSGYLENLLWIDKDGNLLKREKVYDDNFKLIFELVNII